MNKTNRLMLSLGNCLRIVATWASANLLRACALESVTVQTQGGSLILSSSRAAMAMQTNTDFAVIVQSFYGTHKKKGGALGTSEFKSMPYIKFNF
jgi:hypothetical protein